MEATVYVLVGPPGSGKSTYAKALSEKNTEIVSSDAIRYDLQAFYHGEESRYIYDRNLNGEVFNEYYSQLEKHILAGKDVIADSTSINYRDRIRFFELKNKFKKQGITLNIEAHVLVWEVEELIRNNKSRAKEKQVPEFAIIEMLKRFQFPNKRVENWDRIVIIHAIQGEEPYDYEEELLNRADGFDQKNPHHDKDLLGHIRQVESYATDKTTKLLALYHDLGKLYTMTLDEDGIGHFYGHQGVSSYIAAYLLPRRGYSENFIAEMCVIIENHMQDLEKWREDRAVSRLGVRGYNTLKKFQEMDRRRE